MVAIVTGGGLGLERSAGFVLGGAATGRFAGGVSVNAANGNLVLQGQDEILLGLGPDSVFARTHNSQAGWQASIQRTVVLTSGTVNQAGSTATRTGWDGAAILYTYDAGKAAYVAKDGAGAYDQLAFAANVWTWTDGDTQATERYDATNGGRITAALDADGNQLTFAYTSGKLTRVTTADGNYTDLGWTGNNLTQLSTTYTDLVSGTTKTLTRIRYGYDASDRLVTITTDLTPGDNSVADGNVVTVTYAYDGASTRVASISETGSANMVQFTYVQQSGVYRVATVVETVAAGDSRTTSFTYSAGSTAVTDALGNVTTLAYDANGDLTQVTYPNSQTIQYAYNANGDITSITDGGGKITAFAYDANGNRTQERDAAGNTIDRTYGARNELLSETRYLVPDPDGAGSAAASSPLTTRYAYDGENHVRFVVSAEGRVTEYQYSAAGLAVSTIAYTAQSYGGTVTEANLASWAAGLADRSTVERTDTAYDFRGNIATVTRYSAATTAGVGLTTAPYERVTYVYDQSGRLLSRHPDAMTGTEVYAYDGLGRMIGSTDLANAVTSVAFSDGTRTAVVTLTGGMTQTSVYDGLGELISFAEAAGGVSTQTTTYKYDKLGRQRIVNDAGGGRDFIFYDAAGRKTGYMDQTGNLIEYLYDAAGRLITTIEYGNAMSAAQIASLYDANGNPNNVAVASVRPAAATDFWYWNVYDGADRLIETINSEGFVSVNAYDGASRLVSTTSYAAVLTAAQIAGFKTAPPTALVLPAATAASDRVIRNFYDGDGMLVGTLDGIGALVRHVYDGAGRKVATTRFASFTTQGLRASGTFAQLLSSVTSTANPADQSEYFAYDDLGNLRYALNADLRPTEYAYDGNGNVVRTIEYGAPIASAASYSLGYVQGQITSLNLSANAATRVTRAVYDGAGRKAYDIDAEGYVSAYGYDASSRVTRETRYAAKYTASGDPAAAAMVSWAASNPGTADRIGRKVYDGFGRIAYEVDAEGYVTEHQYDLMDRVTKDIVYPATYAVTDAVTQASLAAQIGTQPTTAVVKTYAYNSRGDLIDTYDGNNIRTHYDYASTGELRMTTVGYGASSAVSTLYQWNAAHLMTGRIQGYLTAEQTRDAYSYDGAGNLKAMQTWGTDTIIRAFDNAGNLIQESVSITASSFAVTYRQYDAFGNVVKVTDPRGNAGYFYYDKLNRLTLQVDAEGYATETAYGIGDQPVSVKRYYSKPTGTGSITARPTLTTNVKDELTLYAYDKLDRATSVTDAEGFTESYTLNAFGDRVSVTNKLGGVTINLFDRRSRLIQETLAVGGIVNKFAYDARGNRTQAIEAFGLAEQRTTSYAYDKGDRLTSRTGDQIAVQNADRTTTSLVSPVETIAYDLRGNVIETTNPAGARTLSYYDANDRKIAELNATGTLTIWTYDQSGNKKSARVYGDAVALPATPGGTPPAPANAANYRETLYAYDNANRLIETKNVGIEIGQSVGGVYQNTIGNVVTSNTYDGSGNVVMQMDARGSKSFFFYDRNGRKIAEVDPENYLIAYDLDADGNVLAETRYANRLSLLVGTASSVAALKADAGSNAADRVTQFTYDRNGRRLSETRLNVSASTVSSTGALATATQSATISFAYNGLGLVTRKTEANGDFTDYAFDAMGRNTRIAKSGYTDFEGSAVQPVTDIQYDGLNQVARQIDRGKDNGTEADDRITLYAYDKAGRVIQTTDAAGFVTSSFYDAAGRLVKQGWVRTLSSGATVTEASFFAYDLLGRQTSQVKGTWSGSAWTLGDSSDMRYNGYGDMVARGINTGGVAANYQEFADYDALGRVWRTNFGDGVAKAYAYDAAGNVTLLAQTMGSADLRTMTLAQMVTNSGVTLTQSIYDKRGLLIETLQPSIENAGALPGAINAFVTETAGTNFTGGPMTVGQVVGPATAGSPSSISAGLYVSKSGPVIFQVTDGLTVGGTYVPPSIGYDLGGLAPYGGGSFRLFIGSASSPMHETTGAYDYPQEAHTVRLYQDFGTYGSILVAETVIPGNGFGNTSVAATAPILIQGQGGGVSSVVMYARPQGSTGPYVYVPTSPLLNAAGAAIAGFYTASPASPPFSGLPANTAWEVQYHSMASGQLVNAQSAVLSVNASGVPSFGSIVAQPIGGQPKLVALLDGGVNNFLVATDLPAGTMSVHLKYRDAGSTGGWTNIGFGSGAFGGVGGAWYLLVNGWGPKEYILEAYDSTAGNGAVLLRSTGTFSVGSQPSAPVPYVDQTVLFHGQPAGVTAVTLWYRTSGGAGWSQAALVWTGSAWKWDANAVPPDRNATYTYEFRYEAYAGSVLVNKAGGLVHLGQTPGAVSNTAEQLPARVIFAPPQASAALLVLNYRPAGSLSAYQTVSLLKSNGRFEWDVDALRPASGSDAYEYLYDLYDANGAAIPAAGGSSHASGYIDIEADRSTSLSQLQWSLVGSANPAAVINRKQTFDAYRNITSETDGLGRTNDVLPSFRASCAKKARALGAWACSSAERDLTEPPSLPPRPPPPRQP